MLLLLRYCYWLRLLLFLSSHLFSLNSVYTSHFIQHKYISILKLDTQKSFHFYWLLPMVLAGERHSFYEVFKFYFNVCTEH